MKKSIAMGGKRWPIHIDKSVEYGESLCGRATSGNPEFRWVGEDGKKATCKLCVKLKKKLNIRYKI